MNTRVFLSSCFYLSSPVISSSEKQAKAKQDNQILTLKHTSGDDFVSTNNQLSTLFLELSFIN